MGSGESGSTRRAFLKLLGLSGAALPLAGCPPPPPKVATAAFFPPGMDVHCHVFNAADLPVQGFIVNDKLQELKSVPGVGQVSDYLIPMLAQILTTQAPDDSAERAYLLGKSAPAQDPLVTSNAATMRLLAASLDPSAGPDALPPALADHPERAAFISFVAANLQPGAAAYLADLNDATPDITILSPTEIFQTSPSGTAVSHYFDWAHQMCDFRTRNIDRLFQLYGPERFGVSVIFPSLVDFHRWLGPGSALQIDDSLAPLVPVDAQARLMTQIMRLRGDVLAFIGIDPLRPWSETLALLQTCFPARDKLDETTATGFIGVKIYPPLGYRPFYNAHFDDYFTDQHAATAVRATVEGNLNALYQFCAANDVPVMTHCNHSNYTALGSFGQTGDPTHWSPVLARYPGLRLNLGHFFSVGDFAQHPLDQAHTIIGGFFDAYDHVYADVADATDVSDATFRSLLATALQSFSSAHPRLAQRLMYGSDWDMLGFEQGFETFLGDWTAAIGQAATTLGDADLPARFMTSNALDFLGLSAASAKATGGGSPDAGAGPDGGTASQPSTNLQRTLQFYGGATNAPDWLRNA
jgi:predicted TIM-barrel fold metal-dependent hydrolase